MIAQMLTLGGWIMFALGVLLSAWVRGLISSARSKVG